MCTKFLGAGLCCGWDCYEMTEAPRCRHHFLIQKAKGPTSLGICKLCGEQREFTNSFPGHPWEGSGALMHKTLSRDLLQLLERL